MNSSNHRDLPVNERLLKQVEDQLERGKTSEDALLNALANTTPQADQTFQDQLEARLIAQLHVSISPIEKEEANMQHIAMKTPARTSAPSFLTWAAAVLIVVILGGYGLGRYQQSHGSLLGFGAQPSQQTPYTIVIATRNIRPGETITDDMIGEITLSEADHAELFTSEPERLFFTDADALIGQVTMMAIFWSEPIEPIALGILPPCSENDDCVPLPENYSTIILPPPLIPLETQGANIGDRVDILAASGNNLNVMVEDVLVRDIQDDGGIEFAAPSWKHAILVSIYQMEQAYVVRLNSTPDAVGPDDEVEFTFTGPEPFPDDYRFDLIVRLPVSEGYRLVDAPYNLENIQYSQRETTMQFWFTNIEMRNINEDVVTVEMPAADAANLEFLMSLDIVQLGFQPDADIYH